MKIITKQFGEITFTPDKIITFEKGILGFEKYTKYLFLSTEEGLLYWLNSIDQPELAFPLVGLRMIDGNYPMVENHEPFGVVTLNSDPLKVTVNLKAPVYINQDKKAGYQKIIDKEEYPVYFNLFVE